MVNFFENKLAALAATALFVSAVVLNGIVGASDSFRCTVLTLTPEEQLMAHGPSLPPDPWEPVRMAHGPSLPPDPWEPVRMAHGPSLPPDPWEPVRTA